jgi:hypothetical protein
VRIAVGARRPPGRAVVAGALLSVLAACSSTVRDPAAGMPLVGWDSAVPVQVRVPVSAPALPCQASRLRIVGGGFDFAPAMSGGSGEVALRNAGPDACRLAGRPDVRIVGAIPAPPQLQVPLPAEPPAFPAVVPPDGTLRAVPSGAAVTLDVEWRNWCLPQTSAAPTPPRAIRVALPDGAGSIDVGYNAVPPCDSPSAASTIGVRPFQPAPLARTPPWTPATLQATIEPLTGAQLSGRRGETVRFAVRIGNPSPAPITFERCPLVVEMLAPAGQPEVHQLNCRAAGQLPAGGSVRFEMRILVPGNAPVGPNGLFWELDPTGGQGPEAVSRISVTGPDAVPDDHTTPAGGGS